MAKIIENRAGYCVADALTVLLNVSTASEIKKSTLIDIFSGKVGDIAPWTPQLDEFFSTVPVDTIHKFMAENALTAEDIKRVFYGLPSVWQNSAFTAHLQDGRF